jgi:hypothetical protein
LRSKGSIGKEAMIAEMHTPRVARRGPRPVATERHGPPSEAAPVPQVTFTFVEVNVGLPLFDTVVFPAMRHARERFVAKLLGRANGSGDRAMSEDPGPVMQDGKRKIAA